MDAQESRHLHQQQQHEASTETLSHHISQLQVTSVQYTLFVAYAMVLCFWTLHFIASLMGHDLLGGFLARSRQFGKEVKDDTEGGVGAAKRDEVVLNIQGGNNSSSKIEVDGSDSISPLRESLTQGVVGDADVSKPRSRPRPSGPPPVTLDRFLTSVVMFGAILFYFYICDYLKLFPETEKSYSRDLFLFLVFLFFLVASAYTIKPNEDKILNRDQTEEWKGWMQVMFVWYHYFGAKEWYNWIRIYIACYVWMTGFGNFSFFWVRADFSLWRMLKMLFRLNFLVIFVALVTNNEYMLYYICAMHTYWFLTVYTFMRVFQSWNRNPLRMALKFAAYAVFNAIVFEIPGMSQTVFRPLHLVLGLHDGSKDIMHEWSFRAGLDCWACYFGMICAYNYPHFEKLMAYLDSKSADNHELVRKLLIRQAIAAASICVGCIWFFSVMGYEKYTYNRFHPYTSMIPVLCFIVLRNIHPLLRSYHIGLFAWLGKITLETYLSQFHIYLMANAKRLLTLLVDYPLLNFALATILYLAVSHRLFVITNDVSNFLLPHSKDLRHSLRNFAGIAAVLALSSGIFFVQRFS